MLYPAKLKAEGRDYVVTFRDIPEAITQGNTREEAIAMAADALATAIAFYFEDHRPVPMPSKTQGSEVDIRLPASLSAKVLLLNEMLARNVTPSELARRMGTSPQVVNRIMDISHTTKIDTIADAFQAIGARLDLTVHHTV